MREILSTLNEQPIEFYGKVVDQFGQPVSNAEVLGRIVYNNGGAAGVRNASVFTDVNGRFEFHGAMGRTLDFSITKAGYKFTPEGDAYDFTSLVPENKRHHPNPNEPVIVKMWKLQGAEPLLHGGKLVRAAPDGTPVKINLTTRSVIGEGGDILLSLHHPHYPHGTPNVPHYNWWVEVVPAEGGILEATDRPENMLMAPADGYSPSWRFDQAADHANWTRTFTKSFYVKMPGERYGRLVLNVECNSTEVSSPVQLSWWINLKPGSRILEPPEVEQPLNH